MNYLKYPHYHSPINPRYVLFSISLLLVFNYFLILGRKSGNMFSLKKGIIILNNHLYDKNQVFSNNISYSEIIDIYPNSQIIHINPTSHANYLYKNDIKYPKGHISKKFFDNSNSLFDESIFQTNAFIHKLKHSNIYSESLKSPLYLKDLPNISADLQKQNAIKEAFLHAWKGYKKYSWGHDILHPISNTFTDFIKGGLTIIDSLPSLIIMGFDDELEFSKKFIERNFHPRGEWSLFEFIIRYIGGFISAYYLTNDNFYKNMAIRLGEAVYPIIAKKDGFYSSRFYIQNVQNEIKTSTNYSTKFLGLFHEKHKNLDEDKYILAEVGSFQMEFLALTELTGDKKFAKLCLNVYHNLWKKNNMKGLVSNTIGSGYDSYYEYIIKTYLQTRGFFSELLNQYKYFISDLHKKLVIRFKDFVCIGVKTRYFLRASVEHFTTFAAGMLALGSVKNNENAKKDFKLATDLVSSYMYPYSRFKSGVVPEHILYNFVEKKNHSKSGIVNSNDQEIEVVILRNQYKLRPETVESIYWLWKFTGDVKYRQMAWQLYVSINKTCRVSNGFSSVSNVEKDKPDFLNEMDSYFLSETLTYLYLTFSDSTLLSPSEWVFNTEGHPFKMLNVSTLEMIKDLMDFDSDVYNKIEWKNDRSNGYQNWRGKVAKRVKRRGIIQGPF